MSNVSEPPPTALDREKCKVHLKDQLLLTRSRCMAYRIQGDSYSRKAVMMHLPVLIFNVVSAILSYFLESDTPELRYAIMGFSSISVVLASIDNYLDLGQSALKHQTASRQYDSLSTRISRYYSSIQDATEMLQKNHKVSELIQQLSISPDVPLLSVEAEEIAYERVKEQMRRASFSITRRAIAELTGDVGASKISVDMSTMTKDIMIVQDEKV